MAVVESYPNLKADQQFIDFQREIYCNRKNSIRTETVYYNDSVKDFNTYRKSFPNNIFANFFGDFKDKPYFKAEAGAQKAPEVLKKNNE